MRPSTMFTMQALSGGDIIHIPNPDQSSAKNLIATLVNSGRNANAVVVAQKIGRDQEKTEMSWNYLEKEEWEKMLRFWDKNFFFNFTYFSFFLSFFLSFGSLKINILGLRNFFFCFSFVNSFFLSGFVSK